jgi:hypothetical protein
MGCQCAKGTPTSNMDLEAQNVNNPPPKLETDNVN